MPPWQPRGEPALAFPIPPAPPASPPNRTFPPPPMAPRSAPGLPEEPFDVEAMVRRIPPPLFFAFGTLFGIVAMTLMMRLVDASSARPATLDADGRGLTTSVSGGAR